MSERARVNEKDNRMNDLECVMECKSIEKEAARDTYICHNGKEKGMCLLNERGKKP